MEIFRFLSPCIQSHPLPICCMWERVNAKNVISIHSLSHDTDAWLELQPKPFGLKNKCNVHHCLVQHFNCCRKTLLKNELCEVITPHLKEMTVDASAANN